MTAAVEQDTCPEYDANVCFRCDDRLRICVIVPCVDQCCDRPLCLSCAADLGYEIH